MAVIQPTIITFFYLYSKSTVGITLSSPLHLEHLWSGYLLKISIQYLTNNSSEINPFFKALVDGCSSGCNNDKIHL